MKTLRNTNALIYDYYEFIASSRFVPNFYFNINRILKA